MSSKAVAKGMGTNLFADSGVTDGIAKDHEHVVATDRLARIVSGKEPFFRSAQIVDIAEFPQLLVDRANDGNVERIRRRAGCTIE